MLKELRNLKVIANYIEESRGMSWKKFDKLPSYKQSLYLEAHPNSTFKTNKKPLGEKENYYFIRTVDDEYKLIHCKNDDLFDYDLMNCAVLPKNRFSEKDYNIVGDKLKYIGKDEDLKGFSFDLDTGNSFADSIYMFKKHKNK